jgi:multidrug resistance efflux pump
MKDPKSLPPIPTPFSVIWREFRIRVMPIGVFGLTLCGVWYFWKNTPMGNTIRGVGEGLRSVITSPRIGVIQSVEVQPYQWVEAGDPILTVLPFDPDAQLDLLQSELQLARLRLEPSMADQNALNFEQVRVDWLRLKQELAMAKVNLERSEGILRRNETLLKERLVSQDAYELSLRDRDFYGAEVHELSSSIKEIEGRLGELRGVGEPQSPGTNQLTLSMIARLEARMKMVETNWSAITLTAPISGRVHMISRQASEFVMEGEPLITIASPRSERIVAYIRQPFQFEPQPGMDVEVVIQNRTRKKFSTQIAQVGAQLELITNVLAFIQQGALVDVGLPVILNVPPGIQLRPGEMVSVVVNPSPLKIFGKGSEPFDKPKPLAQVQ